MTFMLNIYIFIAITLHETSILVAVYFSMQNIYQSCDLGRALRHDIVTSTSANNVLFFIDICMMLVSYRHDVKCGSATSWLLQDLR